MNHPLVRRKFRATFLSLELGSGYDDRVVENVEGCRSLAVHDTVLFCSRFFLFFLFPFFFTKLIFFPYILCYFLLRIPISLIFSFSCFCFPKYYIFPSSCFFIHFSFTLLPSSRILVPSPRSGWELGWI